MRKGSIERPGFSELMSLNSWPEGTRGYYTDVELIHSLITLCNLHGYGRVHQLMEQIEEIWRNPESVSKFEKQRMDRLEMFRKSQEEN